MTIPTSQGAFATDGKDSYARRAYLKDGVVQVSNVFQPDEIERMRQVFTKHCESEDKSIHDQGQLKFSKEDILSQYPRLMHPHRRPDLEVGQIARDLMCDKRIQDVVTNLIGPAYGAQSMFYFKPPTARGQAPHQDNWFLQAHPETCLAAWIAVDDADDKNGGVQVVPGSHINEILCHGDSNLNLSFSPTAIKMPDGINAYDLMVQTNLKAGDVLFFHGSLVHGSLPNTSDRFRRVSRCTDCR